MSLITRFCEWIAPGSTYTGPPLRNKPGGMAWIKQMGDLEPVGGNALVGRVVQTVKFNGNNWDIAPEQWFPAAVAFTMKNHGKQYHFELGEQVGVTGLADSFLIPIGEPGYDERDESLAYLPPVPTITKATETV